jgi:hypothetical protein
MIDGSAATTTVIILDCCHSGAFKSAAGSAPAAGRGRYVLTSSRSTQLTLAATSPGQPSPFTDLLVRGLQHAEAPGHLTVVELYRQVHRWMTEEAVIAPQLRIAGEGDVVIVVGEAVQCVDQAVVAGAGGVVLAAGPHRGDPDRPAVRSGDDLHVAAMVLVLPRPPEVCAVGARGCDAVGADDRAVQVEVSQAGCLRLLQCGGQVRRSGRQDRQSFVQVAVGG